MINRAFFEHLENQIAMAIVNSDSEEFSGLGFEAIILNQDDSYHSDALVTEKNEVILQALVGIDGEDLIEAEFELVVRLGEKALDRLEKKLEIKECIPSASDASWLRMNAEQKRIEVQLD